MIFVRNGGNRRKTNARASLLCGEVRGIFFGGRIDPVECVGVSQQRNGNVLNVKPPAMRVRDDCYTKITFPL